MDYQSWCKDVDKKIEEEKLEYQHKRNDAKDKNLKAIEEYKEKNGNYWKYGDVYVPIEMGSIPALDKVNRVSLLRHGSEYHIVTTALASINPQDYTNEEYHEKFCKYDEKSNRWIYIGKDN